MVDYSVLANPAPQANDNGGINYDSLNDDARAAAVSGVMSSTTPDQAAQASSLARQTGQDPNVVNLDLPGAQRRNQIDQATTAAGNKALGDFYQNYPLAPQLAADDHQNLKNFADAAQPSPWDAFTGAIDAGSQQQQLNKQAAFAAATGIDKDQIQSQANPVSPSYSGVDWWAQQAGQMIGGMINSIPAAGTGAGAGAAIGSLGGPIGTGAGAVIGGGAGFIADQIAGIYGAKYKELDAARDANGNKLPESVKQVGALTSGILSGVIMSMTGDVTAPLVDAIGGKLISSMLSEPVINAGISQAVGAVGRSAVSGGVINTGISLASSISSELAKAGYNLSTGENFPTVFNNEDDRNQLINSLVQSFAGGAALFGVGRTIPIGIDAVSNMFHRAQVNVDAARTQQLFDLAQQSQMRERAPEAFANMASRALGADIVRIPPDRMQEILKANPDYFTYVDELGNKIEAAKVNNADIEIPAGDFFAHTTPEAFEAVKDDIRARNGLTTNEANELGEAQDRVPATSQLQEQLVAAQQELEEARTAATQPSKTNFTVAWDPEKSSFIAKDALGNEIGHLDDEFPEGPEKIAFTAHSMVAPEWRRLGVGTELYRQFSERHGGNISPGAASNEAMALWRSKFPEALARHIKSHELEVEDPAIAPLVAKAKAGASIEELAAEIRANPPKDVKGDGYPYRPVTENEPEALNAKLQPHLDRVVDLQDRIAAIDQPKVIPAGDPAAHLLQDSLETRTWAEQKSMWLEPLFPDLAGMTKENFTRYSKALQDMQAAVGKKVADAATRESKRIQGKLYQDMLAKEHEAVAKDINNQRPDLFAADLLRDKNSPKLDPITSNFLLKRPMSEEFPPDLPKEFFEKGGLDPSDYAEITGHDSGAHLIDSLVLLEHDRAERGESPKVQRERIIAEEAARRVEAREGTLEDHIMQDTIDAIMGVKQLDLMIEDLKALGDTPITNEVVQNWAEEKLNRLPVTSLVKMNRFEQAVGREGRAAETALLKGDKLGAFQAKQRQILNFELYRQAREMMKEIVAGQKIMDRFEANRTVEGVSQRYTNYIHDILRRADEPIPRSDRNLDADLTDGSFGEFIYNRYGEQKIIYAPDWMQEQVLPAIKDMNGEQIVEFTKTLQSMVFHGRNEGKLQLAQQTFERETFIAEAIASIENSRAELSDPDKKTFLREGLTSLLRPEKIVDMLDNHVIGPFNKIFKDLKTGEHKKAAILKEFTTTFNKIAKEGNFDHAFKDALNNVELLDEKSGKPMKLSRGHMLMMMLNMGSEGNYTVLSRGYGWDRAAIERFVNSNATKEDWGTVKSLWQMLEKQWPEVKRITKATTGVAVEDTRGRTIMTPNGPVKGGYFPLMPDRSRMDEKQKVTFDATDFQLLQPFVPSTAFKARTGAVYPVDLSLDQFGYRLRELAHAIGFTEPIATAKDVFGDPLIRQAIKERYGSEYNARISDWVKYVARDGGWPDETGMRVWQKMSRAARQNVLVMSVGLRPSTAAIHGGSALGNSLGEVGAANFARAIRQLMSVNRASYINEAFKQSGELQNRGHNLDADVGHSMDMALGENKFSAARRVWMGWSMSMIKTLDLASAYPTFMAARDRELANGTPLADAIYAGDKAVRDAHGSSGLVDLPSIQRGGEGFKWFTMFYGYFNHNFNQIYDSGRYMGESYNFFKQGDIPAAAKAFGQFSRKMFYYLMWPAIVHQAVRGDMKQDENPAGFAAKAIAEQLAGGIPIVRDLSYGLTQMSGGKIQEASGSPFGTMLSGLFDGARESYKLSQGDPSDLWVHNLVAMPMWATGIGTNSLANLAQGGYDKASDNLDDVDWKRFFMDGNPHPRRPQ